MYICVYTYREKICIHVVLVVKNPPANAGDLAHRHDHTESSLVFYSFFKSCSLSRFTCL